MTEPTLSYTDLSRPVDTMPLKVDVLMIHTRPLEHAWVKEAMQSVQSQSYPNVGFAMVDNCERKWSIGQLWNAMVATSDADLVLPMGDDDALTNDFITCMVDGYRHMVKRIPNLVRITSRCTLYDDESMLSAQTDVEHTGMYLRKFLVDTPFDENLERWVGIDMVRRIDTISKLRDQPMSTGIMHHSGYIYRQHQWMVNGRPIRIQTQ